MWKAARSTAGRFGLASKSGVHELNERAQGVVISFRKLYSFVQYSSSIGNFAACRCPLAASYGNGTYSLVPIMHTAHVYQIQLS
jgi:hypothetical protein